MQQGLRSSNAKDNAAFESAFARAHVTLPLLAGDWVAEAICIQGYFVSA